ncbi:MAG: CoA transferase [Dehalococcoidales bacterium]|nr:CoA transferase [Dehalococcoidales bacterium]
MGKEALSGLKVLEYGEFISGPYCVKLLADLGAEVIKVEKPGSGDKARSWGPFPQDIPHPEKSGLFLYVNTNKLGVTLDVRTAAGGKIFRELVKWADVVVESNPPEEMRRLGLDRESLHHLNPRLVITSITPFGQTGPYRDYRACELISANVSSAAYINPSGGVDDIEHQPPLKQPAHIGDFMIGVSGAVGTLSAVIARQVTGRGQHVDLSQQEAFASTMRRDFATYSIDHIPFYRDRNAAGKPPSGKLLYPCKDGFISMTTGTDAFWANLVEMMGNPDWAKGELVQDMFARRANADAIWFMVAEWTGERTVKEVMEAAKGKRIPITPVNRIDDVVNSELAAVREVFVNVEHKEAGAVKMSGAPYRLSGAPWRVKHPAPLLGEHNEQVYCQRLGYTRQDLVRMRQSGVI